MMSSRKVLKSIPCAKVPRAPLFPPARCAPTPTRVTTASAVAMTRTIVVTTAIVVLLATAKAVGLPPEGVALLLGIDFIVDMARTAVDTFGTPLAAVVIAKSEGLFRPQPGIDVRQPATVSDLESRTATART